MERLPATADWPFCRIYLCDWDSVGFFQQASPILLDNVAMLGATGLACLLLAGHYIYSDLFRWLGWFHHPAGGLSTILPL